MLHTLSRRSSAFSRRSSPGCRLKKHTSQYAQVQLDLKVHVSHNREPFLTQRRSDTTRKKTGFANLCQLCTFMVVLAYPPCWRRKTYFPYSSFEGKAAYSPDLPSTPLLPASALTCWYSQTQHIGTVGAMCSLRWPFPCRAKKHSSQYPSRHDLHSRFTRLSSHMEHFTCRYVGGDAIGSYFLVGLRPEGYTV